MRPTSDTVRAELEAAHHDVGELATVLDHWERTRTAASVEAVLEFLRVRVREHFLWEERVLFPRVLATDPRPTTRDVVQRLREQHLELLRDIADVYQDVGAGFLVEGRTAGQEALMARLKPVVDRLATHAKLEDETFLPLLPR